MPHSTPTSTPRKPREPRGKRSRPRLSVHKGTGYWCKKIRGRVYYFGKVADDPDCIAAMEEYLRDKADLEAGREPRAKADPNALTIESLVDQFLAFKEDLRNNGQLKARSYGCLHATCKTVIDAFGKTRTVSDLQPADFSKLHAKLAKTRKLVALGNEIIRVRSLFKFACECDHYPITQPVNFGVRFKRPRRESIDAQRIAHREENGDLMFEASELRLLLDALAGKEVMVKDNKGKSVKVTLEPEPPMPYLALRAMVLLGANCGFGQTDCSSLPTKIVDLDNGWVNFPRVKTTVARRCPLWPETIAAIREWLAVRPAAADPADAKLLFLRRCGMRCVKVNNTSGSSDDAVGKEFAKVLTALGLKRSRRLFYSLRHGFETIGGENGDQHAVDVITGTGFTGFTGTVIVDFGSTAGTSVVVSSATQITVKSPAESAGLVNVTVTTPGGASATSSADQFSYDATPTVTAVSPASGPLAGGTSVTITGTGFTGATLVDFGSTAGTSLVVVSSTQITAKSPAGSAGTVNVTVTTPGGTSATSSADDFLYATGVTAVSTTTATGMYGEGTVIPVKVTFNAPVTVTGTPQLTLNSGATVNYSSGSGTATLTFNYTVVAGQSSQNLDYASTSALTLNGGTIKGTSAGNTAVLTLPATGTDGLASTDLVIVPISDGFESDNFSELPWARSTIGTATNWSIQTSNVHTGTYAAQTGTASASGDSILSVTINVGASGGEFAFWRKVASSGTGGSLIFEIDGTAQLQLSGVMAWQQSYFYVASGSHTFTWVWAGGSAGTGAAYLDDVQFMPGTTLNVEGSSANDVFSFNASSSPYVVALDGEIHRFASADFTNFAFHGNGGSDFTYLTGSASGNSVLIYTTGTGKLINSSAGYTVNTSGMTSIVATGHSGDTAQFFDSAGNDNFYAYADYNSSGNALAGMYGSGYSNSASGFGTNIATNLGGTAAGAGDTAAFYDTPGPDNFYAYTNYNSSGPLGGMYGSYGSGYTNTAKGFATNIGYATYGGNDLAVFYDSLGNSTYYSYMDYQGSGQQLAGMLNSATGFSASARGFGENVGNSTAGSTDTAEFFDSPSSDVYYAYAYYSAYGESLAGMYDTSLGYSNSANGFGTMVGNSINGGSDTAGLSGGPGNDTLYTNASVASLYGNDGSYSESALGFSSVTAIAGQGTNTHSSGSTALTYTLNLSGMWS